jgi:hypothetical protein
MITVNVKVMPAISHMIEANIEPEMTFQGDKLFEIFDVLSLKYGESFENLVYDRSQKLIRKGIMITVNGRHIRYLEKDLDHKLENGDTLSISFVIAGG